MSSLCVVSASCNDRSRIERCFELALRGQEEHPLYVFVIQPDAPSLAVPLTAHILRLVTEVYSIAHKRRVADVFFTTGNIGEGLATTGFQPICEGSVGQIRHIVCEPLMNTREDLLQLLAGCWRLPADTNVSFLRS
eukprot:TRINITY_DN22347_c0_g1_i1.p1 TRINITY_DN22347_c0_g1~~TRINITY_DN22347_c0_g1_i1.p1  ORF type:complete len:136 (-),score=0.93 TRINITY_DN22347_c0_g1_i1:90-497(-)